MLVNTEVLLLATTWTIKVDDSLEQAANRAVGILGYMSKAEMVREAIREFLLRRGIFTLIGDTEKIPKIDETPQESLNKLLELAVPQETLQKIIDEARNEVEAFVFPKEDRKT